MRAAGGKLLYPPVQVPYPPLYYGGSSDASEDVAAEHSDVYLTWGEPAAAVAENISQVSASPAARGRTLSFGIRLHVIVREIAEQAWKDADKLIAMSMTRRLHSPSGPSPVSIPSASSACRGNGPGRRYRAGAERGAVRRDRGECGRTGADGIQLIFTFENSVYDLTATIWRAINSVPSDYSMEACMTDLFTLVGRYDHAG